MEKLFSDKSRIRNTLITIYILIVLGISATARAELTIEQLEKMMPVHQQQVLQEKTYVGQIAISIDGQAYLFVSDVKAYELKSTVDMTAYNGQTVQIDGYELKQKISPTAPASSLDPLLGDEPRSVAAPMLIVLSLSAVAE